MTEKNIYQKAFSEDSLRGKLARYAKTAGREVVEKSLLLYYAMQKPDTPAWARATIISALGYFIVPLDAIADLTPAVGYADDLGVLALAVATVASQIDGEVRAKAAQQLQRWFGNASAEVANDDSKILEK